MTDRGRLVGVVALRDLRSAIEKCQNGTPIEVAPVVSVNNCDVEGGLSMAAATENSNTPTVHVAGASTKPLEQLHFTFDDERTANFIKEQLSVCPLDGISPPRKFNAAGFPDIIAAHIEQSERAAMQEDAKNDVLTPTVKVVHPSDSAINLHSPPLTCIQEENEPVSQQASLKQRTPGVESRPVEELLALNIQSVQQLPTPLLLSMNEKNVDEVTMPTQESVAHAIEYLRRKSLVPEKLKALEEAPLSLLRHDDE